MSAKVFMGRSEFENEMKQVLGLCVCVCVCRARGSVYNKQVLGAIQ